MICQRVFFTILCFITLLLISGVSFWSIAIIYFLNLRGAATQGDIIRTYFRPWLEDTPSKWVRSQPRYSEVRIRRNQESNVESGRHFRPDTINTITETLGAINTVGRYIVNMTRGGGENYNKISEEVPSAIYTISKNVLGRNVTDTIAPIVREALPVIQDPESDSEDEEEDDNPRACTTPDGTPG